MTTYRTDTGNAGVQVRRDKPVPTAVEAHRHFGPGKLARPIRQKQQVRLGGVLLNTLGA